MTKIDEINFDEKRQKMVDEFRKRLVNCEILVLTPDSFRLDLVQLIFTVEPQGKKSGSISRQYIVMEPENVRVSEGEWYDSQVLMIAGLLGRWTYMVNPK